MQIKIMSGVPGAGKTTLLKKMVGQFLGANKGGKGVKIFSADEFHMVEGVYRYDRKRAGEAHDWCFRNYLECVYLDQADFVAVDNTCVNAAEIAPYLRVAQVLGRQVEIIRIVADPINAFRRNGHGVTLRTVMEMHSRLQEPLPPHWPVCYVPAEEVALYADR